MDWATRSKESESHVGVTEWLTLKHILVSDLNVHVLVKFVELLDWNFHVLVVPLWVLASINTNI